MFDGSVARDFNQILIEKNGAEREDWIGHINFVASQNPGQFAGRIG
ncbi:MAG: hypothetical protein H8E94_00525 [Alphaproteobacteria bacterium]|nr:hypothetical protein [Alphaproteobacteria bacterium]